MKTKTWHVRLTPLQRISVTARLRPLDSTEYQYHVFVADTVYEVNEKGLEDLKALRLRLQWNDPRLQQGYSLNLKSKKEKYTGCGGCAKKRGLNPDSLNPQSFSLFNEVIKNGDKYEISKPEYTVKKKAIIKKKKNKTLKETK